MTVSPIVAARRATAHRSGLRWWTWAVYAAAGMGPLLVACFVGPRAAAASYCVTLAASVTAVLIGASRARGVARRPWLLVAAGTTVWAVANTAPLVAFVLTGVITRWPPVALLALLGYPVFIAGVLGLARREGVADRRAATLDSAVAAAALIGIWWLLVAPTLSSAPARVVANANLLGDLGMLVAAVVLFASRAIHARPTVLLFIAILTSIVADVSFGAVGEATMTTSVATGMVLGLWALEFWLIGAAALQARDAVGQHRHGDPVVSLIIPLTALVAPGALMMTLHLVGRPVLIRDAATVLVATAVMAALLGVRLLLLGRQIDQQTTELEHSARTDPLTGLPNRRAGERLVADLVQDVDDEPAGAQLARHCIALIDLDHFKAFNDTHGHVRGDRLLVRAAAAWRAVLTDGGEVVRHGGEEFLVVLPDTGLGAADEALQRLRRVTPYGQSFSAGLTRVRPGDDAHGVVDRADRALYRAKGAGRGVTVTDAGALPPAPLPQAPLAQ